jgi:murein DD-endopeptidase MepM/ murein hydrolase activator NlpD
VAGIEMHNGVDLAAAEGTVVLAAGSGTVSLAGRWTELRLPDYGRLGLFVRIEHGQTGFSTIYGHCSRLLVRRGDVVTAGQPIALVGDTGWSTAPHLHFAICRGEEYFDPREYLLFFDTRSLSGLTVASSANR